MTYHLITTDPIEIQTSPALNSLPPRLTRPDDMTVEQVNDGMPDGYRYIPEFPRPIIDPNTQRLEHADPTLDGWGWVTVDLTDEEITARVEQKASQSEERARRVAEKKVAEERLATEIARVQALPDEEAVAEIDLIPPYRIGVTYSRGDRFQFEGRAYRVEQPSYTSVATQLPGSPGLDALFTRIPFPGEILPWEQPSGAQDAYNTGDRVIYEDQTWESTVDANVFAPGVVAGQWAVVD